MVMCMDFGTLFEMPYPARKQGNASIGPRSRSITLVILLADADESHSPNFRDSSFVCIVHWPIRTFTAGHCKGVAEVRRGRGGLEGVRWSRAFQDDCACSCQAAGFQFGLVRVLLYCFEGL